MKRIEKLTPEQEALIPVWHERWLRIGMSGEPINYDLARSAIHRAYAGIGKPDPLIVFCDSPATSSLGIAVWPYLFSKQQMGASLHASLGASLHASLGASLQDSLHASLGASLQDSLRVSLHTSLRALLGASLQDSLHASLGASLQDSLRASLGASLHASLGASLHASLGASLRASLGASLHASLQASLQASLGVSLHASLGAIANSTWFWGHYDAYWIAFYRFCAEIGVQYKPGSAARLAIMSDLGESCGWIYFHENVCFVSGRPKVKTELIERNGRTFHQLHCADGPAMSFADGYAVFAWHGVRIPYEYYADAPKASEILAEQNVEVRRCLIERYSELKGKGSFMRECGAQVLDTAIQPMRLGAQPALNELLAIDLPGDPDGRIVSLRVIDPSTEREYWIRVPPTQKTVRSALAWTFNMAEKDYALEAES